LKNRWAPLGNLVKADDDPPQRLPRGVWPLASSRRPHPRTASSSYVSIRLRRRRPVGRRAPQPRATTSARRTHVIHARAWCVARACKPPTHRPGPRFAPGTARPRQPDAARVAAVWCPQRARRQATSPSPVDQLPGGVPRLHPQHSLPVRSTGLRCREWWGGAPSCVRSPVAGVLGARAASPRRPLPCTHCRRTLVAPQQVTSEAPRLKGLTGPRCCRHRPRTTVVRVRHRGWERRKGK